jgi:hypothetical protein
MDEKTALKEKRYRKIKKVILMWTFIILIIAILALMYINELEELAGEIAGAFSGRGRIDDVGILSQKNTSTITSVQAKLTLEDMPSETVLYIIKTPDSQVPEQYNVTKMELVNQYIDDCTKLTSTEKIVNCMDVYFLNNISAP